MNDLKRFLLPIGLALPALIVGIVIGRATVPNSARSTRQAPAPVASSSSSHPSLPPISLPVASSPNVAAPVDTNEPDEDTSSGDVISRIKAALAKPGGG